MQPDYNQASGFLFFQILNATVSNGSQFSIPSSPTAFNFSPSRSDEWLNSLWFVSLTLSLITALVAVLVKQWLHQYVAIVSNSSARDRARIRHLRYAGLQMWQVPMIIGLLPVLLHASLGLFFAGLAIFLFSLGMKVAWLVSIIGTATYMAYIIALILPLVYPYCPFKVPLTLYVHSLYQFVHDTLIPLIIIIRHYPYAHVFGRDRHFCLREYRDWRKSFIASYQISPTVKEIERNHVQKCAAKVDAQSLQWLHSSTSNASVHQSVLQAIAGMSSVTLKCLPDEYTPALMVPLEQQIQQIEPLVPSPDVERELELYYRAYILLRPNFFLSDEFPDRDHMADRCCNEQLKMVLFSMTSSQKALAAFLGILRGPQCSSLTLRSVVWERLVHRAIFVLARFGYSTLELELELMKIIARPSSKGESREVTTIDKPTDEMRVYILIILSDYQPLPNTIGSTATGSFALDLRIILTLISRMGQRLCESVHASNRNQLIETSLTIIECTGIVIHNLTQENSDITQVLDKLYSLLSSEPFVIVSPDLQPLVQKIFIILDKYCSRMKATLPDLWIYYVAYQCYLHSPMGGGERLENDVTPPEARALEHLISSSLNLPPAASMDDPESCETPLDPQQYPRFSTDSLFKVILLLIKEHNESVLYEWVQHPTMQYVWPECLSRLVGWASGDEFRQWDLLKRVLAVVVIRELQNMLGHSDDNESLPQYTYPTFKDIYQLPWLYEVAGSSR